jgi:outer membrane protein
MKLPSSRGVDNCLRNRSLLFTLCILMLTAVAIIWALTSAKATAQATPSRIAIIDVQKVLSQSNPGKAATGKLKQLQDARVSRGKVLDAELRKLESDLLAGTTLPPARRKNLEVQIADKRLAMKRFAEDAQKEITAARERELQALEVSVKPIVDRLGKEMALAAIFNKFESGLIYANDAIDITDTVIARFNAATPAQPPRD